jgi:hypothetical protein
MPKIMRNSQRDLRIRDGEGGKKVQKKCAWPETQAVSE